MPSSLPAEAGTLRLRHPPGLHFGCGAIAGLGERLGELCLRRPLLVTDRRLVELGTADQIARLCAGEGAEVTLWPHAEVDPDDGEALQCREALSAGDHDGLVALGGGSVLDLAKVASALTVHPGPIEDLYGLEAVRRPGLPWMAVPTTAGGGGEVSSHAVLIHRSPRRKVVLSGQHLLASSVVVDPRLTLTLPWRETAHAALDGLVHAVEAFLARSATPFTDMYARLALPRILRALPRLADRPDDLEAREALSLGCLASGLAMANANAGAVHAAGYPLSMGYGVPHGLANAMMAAAVLERTWHVLPERSAELATLFAGRPAEAEELPSEVRRFLGDLGLAANLKEWGVGEADLSRLAGEALGFGPVLANAPCRLSEADLAGIYRRAWEAGP